ncbi:MAG TPA: hypothetical protein DDZ91_11960 [Firmicutes bacterium]|nr:hypothetical protein [Bacillota bacterium]
MLSEENSPFSTLKQYDLIAYPCYPRPPGNLSLWEMETLSFLEDVGAATYFQITSGSKQKRKLDSLNRAGLMYKYQLKGERSINIAASRPYSDLKTLLKTLVFTQLVIKLKESFPVQIIPGSNFIHAYLAFNAKTFPVIIIRYGDNVSMLPLLVRSLERLIIISEKLEPEFNKISVPARIVLDKDLMDSLIFYLPDGSKERAC